MRTILWRPTHYRDRKEASHTTPGQDDHFHYCHHRDDAVFDAAESAVLMMMINLMRKRYG